MATLRMWKLLALFVTLFGKTLNLLNYEVTISERKLSLVSPISKRRKYFILTSTCWLTIHTFYCFGTLGKMITQPRRWGTVDCISVMEMMQVYMLVLGAFLPASILAINHILCFTPSVIPNIFNCITQFEKDTKGNMNKSGIKLTL